MAVSKPEGNGPENLEPQDLGIGPQSSCNEVAAHGNIAPTYSSPIRIDSALGASANGGLDNTL